jgi:hypothetical protein
MDCCTGYVRFLANRSGPADKLRRRAAEAVKESLTGDYIVRLFRMGARRTL